MTVDDKELVSYSLFLIIVCLALYLLYVLWTPWLKISWLIWN
jgi:hypothetical protein